MSSIVNLGKLKHIVEIQSCVTTTDEHGFHQQDWRTILVTRAMIEFDKSYKLNKEIWSAEGIETMSTRIFTFRIDPRLVITIKDRVKFKDVYYQIYSINDIDESGRFLKVWANTICST